MITRSTTILKKSEHYFLLLRDLVAFEARAIAFALVLVSIHSLSARRWCCLAFFARFGANRVSLSTKASLNFSAIDNSLGLKRDVDMPIDANRGTAHALGSISLTNGSSNVISGNASLGTSNPLNPKGDGLGFTMIRGHSVDIISIESLSIFGCKQRYKWVRFRKENLISRSQTPLFEQEHQAS